MDTHMSTDGCTRRSLLGHGAGLVLAGLGGCAVSDGRRVRLVESAGAEVTVAEGDLRGGRAGDVIVFRRVPYAANPYVAELRFKAPEPAAKWAGARDATAPGPMPPQPSRSPQGGLIGAPDDLTLNIWAPLDARNAPVMVWLPGGAFYRVDAGETWYDGSAFARKGVIVVTVDYRVGIDGFLQLEGMPANRALLDQLAALRWIQRNIPAFGGNPANVTLAGQSAGAQCVLALLGMQSAKGLFQKAIAQSPPAAFLTPAQAARITIATAQLLKVEPSAQALSGVPWPALIAGVEAMVTDLRNVPKWGDIGGQPPFLPVVDGTVLTAPPVSALRRNAPRDVPLMVGCTDEEARLYLVPGGVIDRVPPPAVDGALKRYGLPADAQSVYRQVRPEASAGDMLAAIESDKTFRVPALRYAEARVAADAPTWYYHFAWSSPAFGGRLGAGHVVDVPYVFDTLASRQAGPFLGGTGHQPLADYMHARWAAFIKDSDPGWPRYRLDTRPTMRFDTTSSISQDPLADRRKLWLGKLTD